MSFPPFCQEGNPHFSKSPAAHGREALAGACENRTHPRGSSPPVSYTHLLRKGQSDLFQLIAAGIFHDCVHRNIQIDTAAVDDNVGAVDRTQACLLYTSPTSTVGCFSFALKIVIHYRLSILSSAHRSGRSSVQGHKTVSYTHLDVYKRQRQGGLPEVHGMV